MKTLDSLAIVIPKHLDPLVNLPTGLFISHKNVSTVVKRLQDLIGLRVNYNYRDSSLKGTLLENSGGDQNM